MLANDHRKQSLAFELVLQRSDAVLDRNGFIDDDDVISLAKVSLEQREEALHLTRLCLACDEDVEPLMEAL